MHGGLALRRRRCLGELALESHLPGEHWSLRLLLAALALRKVTAHCLSSTSFLGLKETVSPVPLPGKEKGFTPMLSTWTAGAQDVTLIPMAISCNFQNLPPMSFQFLLLVLSPPVSPLLCSPPSLLPLLLLSLPLSLLSPPSLSLSISTLLSLPLSVLSPPSLSLSPPLRAQALCLAVTVSRT